MDSIPGVWDLVFQAGMVAAFIFYALRRDRQEASKTEVEVRERREEREKRDAEWRGFLETQGSLFRSDAEKRDAHWTELLEAEREQRKAGMDYGMQAVKSLNGGMTRLVNVMAKHEQAAVHRHGQVIAVAGGSGRGARRPNQRRS